MNNRIIKRRSNYKILREAGFSSKEATYFKSRKKEDIDQLIDIKTRSLAMKKDVKR